MRPFPILFAVGGVLASGALGAAAYTARLLNGERRPNWEDRQTFSPWELGVPYEQVRFQADDGVVLRGWLLRRAGASSCIVGCAGHRRAKHDLLGIGSGLWRAGHHVVLFDFRGNGESEIAPSSLAYHEVRDAHAALHWVRSTFAGIPVGLIGYSMGAAVALLTAADDTEVRAVVADSSFSTMHEVVAHAYRRRRLPATQLAGLTDWWQRARYGYGFADVRPIDAVGSIAPRPVLLVHGGRDVVVPVEQARQLYAAAGEPRELWIVEDAPHCGAYFVDRERYVDTVANFFAAALD